MRGETLSGSASSRWQMLVLTAWLLGALLHASAAAAGVVGSGTPGSCTEAALNDALSLPGTVTFNCGPDPHTIVLTETQVFNSGTRTIDGGGKITLSGGATAGSRVRLLINTCAEFGDCSANTVNLFDSSSTGSCVDDDGCSTLNLRNIRLINGDAGTSNSGAGGAILNMAALNLYRTEISGSSAAFGGGIYNQGTLAVTESSIAGNSALDEVPDGEGNFVGGYGGGIFNADHLTLRKSTVSGNQAARGGGIYATYDLGRVFPIIPDTNEDPRSFMLNSTLSDNTAGDYGGALRGERFATYTFVNIQCYHCTIAGNIAPTGAGISTDNSGGAHIDSSLLVDNGPGVNCDFVASGYGGPAQRPLVDDSSCFNSDPVITTSQAIAIGPLADNGGPTMTRAIAPGSIAVDSQPFTVFEGDRYYDCNNWPTESMDQRGSHRPQDGNDDGDLQCDAGAFEYNPNTAPTISDVTDQSIDRNSSTGLLVFTVEDAETAAEDLVVSAASDNQTLVPDGNITLAFVDDARGVMLTPAANQSGSASITLTVQDPGGLSASDSFQLTVDDSDNAVPTISNIANKSTKEDTAITVPFTVGDADDGAGALMLTASSGNDTLIPAGGISFGGSGASRSLTLTPAANQSGTALITVTADDGDGGTVSDSFQLTVTAVNDAPTISSISDQTINEDENTGALAITLGDIDANDPPAGLTLTRSSSNTSLVPLAGIVFGGSGADRTVTITPAANRSGSTTITVTVSDGQLKASTSFLLTVTNVDDGPPTISAITGKKTMEDDPIRIRFSVADANDPLAGLTLSGASSNTGLVPVANMTFSSGSGGTRYLTVTPAANQSGLATLTVTVTDADGNTANAVFDLNVTAVNDAPTIQPIADLTATSGEETQINFSVADVDSDVGGLVLTRATGRAALIPLANISLGGGGSSRSISFTPVAGKTGTVKITLKVSDGKLSSSESFIVTVQPGT